MPSNSQTRGGIMRCSYISVLFFAVACAAPIEQGSEQSEPGGQSIVEPAVTFAPVVGGQATDACDWPSTVDVNGCTGTLIHPRVVTTAAHCMQGSSGKVTFTAGKGVAGSFSLTGKCKAGARGSSGGGTGRDWAYCVIPEDDRVKKFQITPPLVGCEAEKFLKVGNKGWVVGFGTTGPEGDGYGIKRAVEVKINKIGNGIIDIGDKDVGACHGDSGGPIYMKLTDGMHDWGYRVFGSTSSAGGNCDCTCSTIYVNIAQHVKAIEENEMIDVTPCTDAEGNWAPGPDCKSFQSTPENGSGTYPACTVAVTQEPIATCGAPGTGPAAGSGAAGTGAAGFGAAAGSGAIAGAAAPAAGGGAAGFAAAGVGAAGSGGQPAAVGGVAGLGASGTGTAGFAAIGGASGFTAPGVTGAAGRAGSAGVPVGTTANGVTANAGTSAVGAAGAAGGFTAFASQPPAESGGCQLVRAESGSGSTLLWGNMLVLSMLIVPRFKRRFRRDSY